MRHLLPAKGGAKDTCLSRNNSVAPAAACAALQGTRDYSAFLTLPAAVAMMRALGTERMARYRRGLLEEAARLLTTTWGTQQVGPGRP